MFLQQPEANFVLGVGGIRTIRLSLVVYNLALHLAREWPLYTMFKLQDFFSRSSTLSIKHIIKLHDE